MASSTDESRQARSDFLENWYKTEKTLMRLGGVVLLFAAALIAAFDNPGDTWTVTGIAGCLAGGITLLSLHLRPRGQRTILNFLKSDKQRSRATLMGMVAMILITQLNQRPLALIIAAVLGGFAIYYQWRVYKITQFDNLFEHDHQGDTDE